MTAFRFSEHEAQRFTEEVAEHSTKRETPLFASRPADSGSWRQFPSNSVALSDTRSVTDESVQKRKETQTFGFGPWPQASQRNSWKMFFAAKCLVSGDRRRITHWRIGPLRSRVRHARTLDSKIAKGIMNIIPAVFKKKINFLEDAQYKN